MNINPSDIEVSNFPKAPTSGMQLGKIETGVMVKHFPTGISVVCESERSMHSNRSKAMQYLQLILDNDMNKRNEAIEKVAKRAVRWNAWWMSHKPDKNIEAPELLNAIQKDLKKALAMPLDNINHDVLATLSDSKINAVELAEWLVRNGISVSMGMCDNNIQYFINSGFYKSDGNAYFFDADDGSVVLNTRYNQVNYIESFKDVVRCSHDWYESSKHRFDGWKYPPDEWIELYQKLDNNVKE